MKFTEKIGDKKLSVSYYQEKRLKRLSGIGKKTFPIYFVIIYKKQTLKVRSILWKRLFETNNDFLFGITIKDKSGYSILEGAADIEKAFFNDKEKFSALCEHEFECLKRIITFACQGHPETVKQIVDAYNFWGKDGLREASTTILDQLMGPRIKDPASLRSVALRKFDRLSDNAAHLIRFLLDNKQDPVSVLCFLEETGLIERLEGFKKSDLYEAFSDLIILIFDLAHNSVGIVHEQKGNSSFGIYYFPKIHFFYPPSDDLSKRLPRQGIPDGNIKAIDLLKLQQFLATKDE